VSKKTPAITIAICTYNRAHYLRLCLESLLDGVKKYPEIDVLVVDNNSKDETAAVCASFSKLGTPISRIVEEKQGLSYARNKAYSSAKGYYVAYLDDDGIAHNNYVDRLVQTASECDYDCFGGMYYAYYETKKPKWLAADFGTKKKMSERREIIHSGYLSGGNFICKKKVLQAIGGFDPNFGMSGTKIGYGEEDNAQYAMRVKGYTIAFDPHLGIDHLVSKNKMKPSWHVGHVYKQNRDILLSENHYSTLFLVVTEFFKITFKYAPRFIVKFFNDKNFYWQNLYISIFGNYARVLGMYNNKNSYNV
jgi:glycosyltransferase involved in cell wall biosynthesis